MMLRRMVLFSSTVLATAVLLSPIQATASAPADACKLVTKGDLNRLGITSEPKSRATDSPHQAMRSCSAGTGAGPPMLFIMIQDIKVPMAVQMGRKSIEEDDGEAVSGPWDVAKISTGADGMRLHFFKGNMSVMVHSSKTDAATRATLLDIAKRAAGK